MRIQANADAIPMTQSFSLYATQYLLFRRQSGTAYRHNTLPERHPCSCSESRETTTSPTWQVPRGLSLHREEFQTNDPLKPFEITMDASPLKKLPPELRNRIYERVLSRPNGVQVRMKGDEPRAYYSSRALAATCRAVRSEALGIFWSINDFHITTHHFQFCTTSNPVFGKPIKCQDGPFAKI